MVEPGYCLFTMGSIPTPTPFFKTSKQEAIMLSFGFYLWFPIGIVLSAISVAISIIILEKIQEKLLQLNKRKIEIVTSLFKD